MESIKATNCLVGQTLQAYKNKKKALAIRVNSLQLNRFASSGLMQMMTDLQWMLDLEDDRAKAAEVIRNVSRDD